jgi:hypothetical protein
VKLNLGVVKNEDGTRADFTYHQISMPRWTQCGWLVPGAIRGQWVIGSKYSPFAGQHPKNYVSIEADYETWREKPKDAAA